MSKKEAPKQEEQKAPEKDQNENESTEQLIFKNTLIFLNRVSEIKGINENAAYTACVQYYQSKIKN